MDKQPATVVVELKANSPGPSTSFPGKMLQNVVTIGPGHKAQKALIFKNFPVVQPADESQ